MDQLSDLADPADTRLPGCRLQRLELFNWGTFDQQGVDLRRRRPQRAADRRHRLGQVHPGRRRHHTAPAGQPDLLQQGRRAPTPANATCARTFSVTTSPSGTRPPERHRPVALRDTSHYSVILGVFAQRRLRQRVTLAQVFRARDLTQGQPDRFYRGRRRRHVDREGLLRLRHRSSPASRRKLRDLGARIYDTFPDYGRDFRRHLGIESEQAMDLFHQTVSMKAVDNLNDFVRAHMLEPFDTKARIESLVEHFDNLTRAHDAVIRATRAARPAHATDRRPRRLRRPRGHHRHARTAASCAAFLLRRSHPSAHRCRARAPRRSNQRTRRTNRATRARRPTSLRDKDERLGLQIAGPRRRPAGGHREVDRAVRRRAAQATKKFDRFNELLERGRARRHLGRRPVLQDAGTDRVARRRTERATSTSLENDLTERRHEHRSLNDDAQGRQ